MVRRWPIILTLLTGLIGCFSVTPDTGDEDASCDGEVGLGCELKDFTLRDETGVEHRLHDLRGKVVLIAVGAEWCVACRAEMPVLAVDQQELVDDGFVVIYVLNQDNNNQPASASTVQAWVDEYQPPFVVVSDPADRVKRAYGSNLALPLLILTDRSLRVQLVGDALPLEEVRSEAERFLLLDE